jgi:hypothetical protein
MKNIYDVSRALKTRGLSKDQIELVNQIDFEKSTQTWWISKITQYLKNNYPLDVLVKNQYEIKKLGRDSSSIKSYILRFGEDLGSKMFNEKITTANLTFSNTITNYDDDARRLFNIKRGASLPNFLKRYGTEIGEIKWNEYLATRAATYHSKRENGHVYPKYNLKYYQTLHGDEKGATIYYNKINSQRFKVSRAYYIEQFGPILGPIKCRLNKDHASLRYFENKFGSDAAMDLYAAQCLKTSLAVAAGNSNRYSKISKACFDKIKETITDLIYYGPNELTWAATGDLKKIQRAVSPDLFYRGKIIEFNGDTFHANPARFKENDHPHPYNKKITAKEIWEYDKIRLDYYVSKSYNALVIWELDFKQRPQEVISQCIQHLMS